MKFTALPVKGLIAVLTICVSTNALALSAVPDASTTKEAAGVDPDIVNIRSSPSSSSPRSGGGFSGGSGGGGTTKAPTTESGAALGSKGSDTKTPTGDTTTAPPARSSWWGSKPAAPPAGEAGGAAGASATAASARANSPSPGDPKLPKGMEQRVGKLTAGESHQNPGGGTSQTFQGANNHSVLEVNRADGKPQLTQVRNQNGKVISQTYYNKDGNVSHQITQHKDGKGNTVTHTEPNGNTTSYSTRNLKNGTQAITKTTLTKNPDGTAVKSIQYPNGKTEDHTFAKVDGRNVMVQKTEKFPDGTQVTTVRQPGENGNFSYRRTEVGPGGQTTVNEYHYHSYGGVYGAYSFYTPYYHPYFGYPFFVSPYATPFPYGWNPYYGGWYGAVMFPYYGWFTPYPTYGFAYYWITDLLIADMINERYQQNAAVNPQTQASQQAEIEQLKTEVDRLKDEVKDDDAKDAKLEAEAKADHAQIQQLKQADKEQLANQVKEVVAQINTNSQHVSGDGEVGKDPIQDIRSYAKSDGSYDSNRIYTVNKDVEETVAVLNNKVYSVPSLDQNPETCSIATGDLVKIVQYDGEHGQAFVNLVSSIGDGDSPCEINKVVAISAIELQDMLNDFTIKVQDGMTKYNDKTEKNQIPKN